MPLQPEAFTDLHKPKKKIREEISRYLNSSLLPRSTPNTLSPPSIKIIDLHGLVHQRKKQHSTSDLRERIYNLPTLSQAHHFTEKRSQTCPTVAATRTAVVEEAAVEATMGMEDIPVAITTPVAIPGITTLV